MLVLVLDALAQIGFGFTDRADIGGKVAYLLLVGALHHDLGLRGALIGDALGSRQYDGVREANVDGQHVVFHGSAVTSADELQRLGETLRHTVHHVRQESAVQTVHGFMGLGIAGARKGNHVTLLLDGDYGVDLLRQGALGTLDGDEVVFVDRDRHAGGNRNRKLTDSRHFFYLLSVCGITKRSRELRRPGFPCGGYARSRT